MKNSIKSKLKRIKKLLLFSYKNHKPIYIDHKHVSIKNKDKNKVWAFCAGQYSNDFRINYGTYYAVSTSKTHFEVLFLIFILL